MQMNPIELKSFTATSPAEIAARATKSSRYVLAENSLGALRARREGLRDQIRTLITRLQSAYPAGSDQRQVLDLEREIGALEAQIKDQRGLVRAFREEHSAAVAIALKPLIQARAGNALSALANLREATAHVGECLEEIRRAGGDVPQIGIQASVLEAVLKSLNR